MMDGFVSTILLFLVFVLLMVFLASYAKGKLSAYLISITATVSAWFVGLVLDADFDFGEPAGFLCLRILLPILAMGVCILNEIIKDKSN